MTSYTAVVLILCVAAAGLFLDANTPATRAESPEASPVSLPPPSRGSAYCPPLTDEDEGARVTVVAVDGDATVEVLAGRETVHEAEIGATSPTIVDVPNDLAERPIVVRWSGAPVVVTYATVGDGAQVTQACPPTTEPRWHLSGLNTMLGNSATVHLFNPFSVDAVAQVRYATPDGAVDLVTTQDLAVPAGEAVAIDIDEVQPEVADLGVIVDVLSGRLVAAGQMRFGPPDEDTPAPTGRTAIRAVAEPATEQMFPFAATAEDAEESWVSIMNPDPDREAVVVLTVSAPDPGAPVQSEVAVPPGATVRADLTGLSERRTFATVVSSLNDVGVVATRYVARTDEDASAVDAGSAVPPSREWLLVGAGETGAVDVFNPGGEPANVQVQPLADGVTADAVPPAWRGASIDPNAQHAFPLSDLGGDVADVAVRVDSDVPVVAGMRSAQSDRAAAGFRTLAGFPLPAWVAGPQTRPTLDFAPELDRQALPSASPTPSGDEAGDDGNGAGGDP